MTDTTLELDVDRDVIGTAVRRVYVNFRVALPAAAMSFERDTSRVSGEFRVRTVMTTLEAFDEPTAPALPVMLYGGGGYGFHMDLSDGDPMMVLACDGPIAGYYETGDSVTPQTGQSHDYGCAVAFPGGRISSSTAPTPPVNAKGSCVIGALDGSATLTLSRVAGPTPAELGTVVVASAGPTASLLLGGPLAADPVACANEVLANMQTLNTAVQGIPPTGDPITQPLLAAFKVAFAAWFASLQLMGDLKARVEGPVPLP